MSTAFGIPRRTAQTCTHGYVAIPEGATPAEVAGYFAGFAPIRSISAAMPSLGDGPTAPEFRAITLPARRPEPEPEPEPTPRIRP